MKKDYLAEALQEISDKHIEEAAVSMYVEQHSGRKNGKRRGGRGRNWKRLSALAACLLLLVCVTAVMNPWKRQPSAHRAMAGTEKTQAKENETEHIQKAEEEMEEFWTEDAETEVQWGSSELKNILVSDIASDHYINEGENACYLLPEYENMKKEAGLIVKAEALDDLSDANSMGEEDYSPKYSTQFCSERKIKILKVYQNRTKEEYEEGDIISVQQNMAIYPINGEYYFIKQWGEEVLLEKGGTYLLYLTHPTNAEGKSTAMSGNRVILSGSGAVSLDNVKKNHKIFFRETVKTLVGFESSISEEEKDLILNAEDIVYCENYEELEKEHKITFEIDTAEKTVSVAIGYKINADGVLTASLRQEE